VDAAHLAGHFGENSAYFCITPSLFPPPFARLRRATLLHDKTAPVAAQRCGTRRENDAPFHPVLLADALPPPRFFAVIKSGRSFRNDRVSRVQGKLRLIGSNKFVQRAARDTWRWIRDANRERQLDLSLSVAISSSRSRRHDEQSIRQNTANGVVTKFNGERRDFPRSRRS